MPRISSPRKSKALWALYRGLPSGGIRSPDCREGGDVVSSWVVVSVLIRRRILFSIFSWLLAPIFLIGRRSVGTPQCGTGGGHREIHSIPRSHCVFVVDSTSSFAPAPERFLFYFHRTSFFVIASGFFSPCLLLISIRIHCVLSLRLFCTSRIFIPRLFSQIL